MSKIPNIVHFFVIVFFFIGFINLSLSADLQKVGPKLLLLDTTQRESCCYEPFITLAKSVGFSVAYQSIAEFLDDSHKSLFEADAIFCLLSVEFLRGMHNSEVAQQYLAFIKEYSAHPHKCIGLFFPSIFGTALKSTQLIPLWQALGIEYNGEAQSFYGGSSINEALAAAMVMINNGIEGRTIPYHTALNGPHIGHSISFFERNMQGKKNVMMLPKREVSSISPFIKPLLPLGMYWPVPNRDTHILIGSVTMTFGLGLMESCHISPSSMGIRYAWYNALQQFLWQLKELLLQHPLKKTKLTMPDSLLLTSVKKGTSNSVGAWMEVLAFEKSDNPGEELKKQQMRKQLLTYIVNAKLDYLWLSLAPQQYYSVIGKNALTKKRFLDSVEDFMRELSMLCQKTKVKSPRIFIGIELMNNIDSSVLKNSAGDLYGNSFADVPMPLDYAFWKQEVMTPLPLFLADINKRIKNCKLQFSGVVLDFELYGRKLVSSFHSTMLGPSNPLHYKSKKFYFDELKKQAETLGNSLREAIELCIANPVIGCYLPNLSLDWFYEGIERGLARNNRLLLLTFNTLYHPYQTIFEKRGIVADHGTVLMLSKFKTIHDVSWIKTLLAYHPTLWLNRFSRMVEPYQEKSWFSSEQTPLDKKQKNFLCSALAQISKKN